MKEVMTNLQLLTISMKLLVAVTRLHEYYHLLMDGVPFSRRMHLQSRSTMRLLTQTWAFLRL
jgi:hypothetical protein